MEDTLVIILAAGMGTRMKSERIKVLHKLAGKPILTHVLDKASRLSNKIVCVVGHQADEVKKQMNVYDNLDFVYQKEQLGTGHAVMQAEEYIRGHNGPVLVLYGDTPLLRLETLQQLLQQHTEHSAGMTILTSYLDNPTGYGRIIRDESGILQDIVEEQDADSKTKEIKEINTGLYCFNADLLEEALQKLDNDNQQNEYYLPETMNYIREKAKITTSEVKDSGEIIGINDRRDLADAEKIIRKRINNLHLRQGVTLIDPDNTYIDADVVIGEDTIIYPNSIIKRGTQVGRNVRIGPGCQLDEAIISENTVIKQGSIILNSKVGSETTVGPYAYLRPETKIGYGCRIGNFVELKKTSVGSKSKVPHLSYVGDAEIGERCNVGAGTIFANYDGKDKHKTELGDDVFIGSNTTLVAPVKVGNFAKTGAGSVVTKDVADKTTVLGVPARLYRSN
ncbi:MAG: bifunctional UDP-N-acetylglucosamine diphosphorylase/glucosamine-1-phosphate N-acetyltransferase GlmU [Bacillota bacterium]